jgi:glucose-6-phosphate dehydrogenase assembly protein OpcA
MQPSSGGFFSIQSFSTEAAAFVMPILFPDYCEYTWYPCARNINSCILMDSLGRGARNINSCILMDSLNINKC